MRHQCDACGEACSMSTDGPTDLKDALPKGWRPRRIDGRVYVLCGVCGNLRQFTGGLSPYLQDRLSLPQHVQVEFPEYEDFPDHWLSSRAKDR